MVEPVKNMVDTGLHAALYCQADPKIKLAISSHLRAQNIRFLQNFWMFWHGFLIDSSDNPINLIQIRLGIDRNINQNPHIATGKIAYNGDISVGHKVKSSVRIAYLRSPNPNTNNRSCDLDSTIGQANIIPYIQLTLSENKETVDQVGQKALRPHPNGYTGNPCPS